MGGARGRCHDPDWAPNFPSGVLFEGYQNALWQSEMIDGIKVVRVWTFMVPNRGVLLRLLDFLEFYDLVLDCRPVSQKAGCYHRHLSAILYRGFCLGSCKM